MEEIKGNKFFQKAKNRAAVLLKNKEKINQLLQISGRKISEVNFKQIKNSALLDRFKVITRLIRAYAKGEYRQIQVTSILLLVAAIVYFVTPIDLVPDFIPITGLIDDFSIILWVYNRLKNEIDMYISWEQERNLS